MRHSLGCPVCGAKLSAADLLKSAKRTFGFFFPVPHDTGIECPSCFTPLRVWQWYCLAGTLATVAAAVLLFQQLRPLIGKEQTPKVLFLFGLIAVWMYGLHLLHRHLIRFRAASPEANLDFPLGTRALREKAENLHEQRRKAKLAAAAEQLAEQADHEAARARGEFRQPDGPWNCDECREENPREFWACWNCGTGMPKHVLPTLKD